MYNLEAACVPHQSKQRVRPVFSNALAAESMNEPLQQTRVLAFFGDEKLQGLMIAGVIRDLFAHLGDEKCAAASLAELKMGERMRENTLQPRIERAGQVPFRFRAIESVVLIIIEPLL